MNIKVLKLWYQKKLKYEYEFIYLMCDVTKQVARPRKALS